MQPRGLHVPELDRKMKSGEPPVFLDVREEWERSLYPSPEGFRIPLSRLASEWGALAPCKDREIVVCCLFGSRSRDAVRFLAGKGFERLFNLEGGLEEWFLFQEQEDERQAGR
jgi:rhodanese-related sulfurtransferase